MTLAKRRKTARRALGAADLDLLEAAFENLTNAPFFVKAANLKYVAANPAMVRLCGAKRKADLIGRRAAAFFPEALARRYESLDRQVLATGRSVVNAVDLSLSAGRVPTWLIFSRMPVRDAAGAPVGVLASATMVGFGRRDHAAAERLARAVAWLKERLEAPLDIGRLAREAGVSPAQLQRDFRAHFSLTPGGYLKKLRIEQAISLIEDGRAISDIAFECGYADHSAFTRSFNQVMGMSPKRYRELLQS